MLASDRGFSEAKQIYVCVHTYAGWSHGRNHTCIQTCRYCKRSKYVYSIYTWWSHDSDHTCVFTYIQKILVARITYVFLHRQDVLWQKWHACDRNGMHVYTYVGYFLDKDLMFVSVYTHMGAGITWLFHIQLSLCREPWWPVPLQSWTHGPLTHRRGNDFHRKHCACWSVISDLNWQWPVFSIKQIQPTNLGLHWEGEADVERTGERASG